MRRLCFASALLIAVGMVAPARAQEKVSFPSTDSDLKGGTPTTIAGCLYKPEGAGPFGAVIALHGCNGAIDEKGTVRELYGAWGERLSKAGYLVLLPDSFGSRAMAISARCRAAHARCRQTSKSPAIITAPWPTYDPVKM